MGDETVARAIDRLADATRENAKAMRQWIEVNRTGIASRIETDRLLAERTALEIRELRARIEKAESDARISFLMADALEQRAAD